MEFETRFSAVFDKLKNIAAKYSGFCRYTDSDDLYSEMRFYLWQAWREGGLKGKTESYITQACYFHIRNYLRSVKDSAELMSLDGSFNSSDSSDDAGGEGSGRLEDMMPDGLPGMDETLESNALYEKIMSNGLSMIEKDIVRYLYSGYTVREIGRILGLSHVMIVKHKKQIAEKVTINYSNLLV
jgi:DNA-directed RNA polymerase specialized sigma subunit